MCSSSSIHPSIHHTLSFTVAPLSDSLLFCVAFHKTWCTWGGVRLQPPEGRVAGGEEYGGGEEKRTPYGLKKPEFLAHLQDADPEHWKVERWHRSDWFCSAADVQPSLHGREDKNSSPWTAAWRNLSAFLNLCQFLFVPCKSLYYSSHDISTVLRPACFAKYLLICAMTVVIRRFWQTVFVNKKSCTNVTKTTRKAIHECRRWPTILFCL